MKFSELNDESNIKETDYFSEIINKRIIKSNTLANNNKISTIKEDTFIKEENTFIKEEDTFINESLINRFLKSPTKSSTNNLSPGSVYKKNGRIYLIDESGKHQNLLDNTQSTSYAAVSGGGLGERDVRDIVEAATGENTENTKNESGIEFTGAFAGKPLTNNYAWQTGTGINITSTEASAGIFKTFSLDRAVHLAVDVPYWSDPVPASHIDKGVFGGSYLPSDVPTVFDYVNVDPDTYEDGTNVVTTGGLDMSNFKVGDTIKVRFDFNVIPQMANTTISPAIWYKNRDSNNNVTFTFPLTASPISFGNGTVGKTYLNRTEISVYIASQEDINAIASFAIKSDNMITIQPLSSLVTLIR